MSAGANTGPRPDRDPAKLAPKFRAAVAAALAECHDAGLDAMVFEGFRSEALHAVYYARGRTVKPPKKPVTYAKSSLYSWHGYGLAVDVISASKFWDAGDAWFAQVASIFKKHGLKWGGDWKRKDLPHFQWGRCKASPSNLARKIMATDGVEGVWRAVGAA